MDVKSFRAESLQAALTLVRRELGPEAAVLHTREVRTARMFGLLGNRREFEVTASAHVNVPSRLPARWNGATLATSADAGFDLTRLPPRDAARSSFRDEIKGQIGELQSMVEDLCRRSSQHHQHELPPELFQLYTELIDADVNEDLARELVRRAQAEAPPAELADHDALLARIAASVEQEIAVAGPIQCPGDARRVVALVGPTGVGKTTTIAKLAANFRLRHKRRVGLITVDTYRIAAVEQLRTYADIIDLPMHVVSTPREMRTALAQLADQELVLIDTAGRSPRDEVKLQELKAFLAEARADEVHLVMSSVAGTSSLKRTAEEFALVGTTAMVLTKLDEAAGLGNLLPLLRSCRLPLSYLTDGQNVPDDIAPANAQRLAHAILGLEPPATSTH
ncbi:MAG: flagellar biosynthesis protein FlhF [Pirellulales bacterium]|nr:flagellar biosynthesis protein FlhF [Pirellulales bacterium]